MKGKNKKEVIKTCGRLAIITLLLFKVIYSPAPPYDYEKKEIVEAKKLIQRIKNHSSSAPVKTNFAKKKKQKDYLHELIIRIANRYNVDPALIKAIIKVESCFNPKAVSHKGAKGLMQLMPVTLKAMGVRDPFNPAFNIEAGVKYFKKLLIIFNNDVELALAAYNAGITRVKLYKGIPPFRRTKRYVKKVLYYYRYYKREMLEASSGDHDA